MAMSNNIRHINRLTGDNMKLRNILITLALTTPAAALAADAPASDIPQNTRSS